MIWQCTGLAGSLAVKLCELRTSGGVIPGVLQLVQTPGSLGLATQLGCLLARPPESKDNWSKSSRPRASALAAGSGTVGFICMYLHVSGIKYKQVKWMYLDIGIFYLARGGCMYLYVSYRVSFCRYVSIMMDHGIDTSRAGCICMSLYHLQETGRYAPAGSLADVWEPHVMATTAGTAAWTQISRMHPVIITQTA
jgi:hypothetical protein